MSISTELAITLITGGIAVITSAVAFFMGRGNRKELSTLTGLKAQMETTQTNLAVLRGIIEELRTANKAKAEEITGLTCRIDELEKELASKDGEINKRDVRIEELESQVRDLERKVKALEQRGRKVA